MKWELGDRSFLTIIRFSTDVVLSWVLQNGKGLRNLMEQALYLRGRLVGNDCFER